MKKERKKKKRNEKKKKKGVYNFLAWMEQNVPTHFQVLDDHSSSHLP